jgi:hypothetical protein
VGLHVDLADRVAHQWDQQVAAVRPAALDLERLAGRERDHAAHAADLRRAVRHDAALEVLGPPLALAQGRSGGAGDEQLLAPQRFGGPTVVDPRQAEDRPVLGARAAHDLGLDAGDEHRDARREQPRPRVGHVEAAVQPVWPPDAAAGEPGAGRHQLNRRCRRARGGPPVPPPP